MLKPLQRRDVLIGAGGVLGALALPGCFERATGGATQEVVIGYVSPRTGPLALFGAPDNFVIDRVTAALNAGAFKIGDKRAVFKIVSLDSESTPAKAGAAAEKLVNQSKVDVMVCAHTPDTTNPVSAVTELAQVPCVSAVAPVDPWMASGPYPSTFLMFWDISALLSVYTGMWKGVPTNKTVGVMWPDDPDGHACQEAFAKALPAAGYKVIDPGFYPNGSTDFKKHIEEWKKAGCEILTGAPIPPDWIACWQQSHDMGFKPKIASIAKAILFPEAVQALKGDLGAGLTTEVWWSPQYPFKSELTGETPASLCAAYPRQWTQPLGFTYALFEVAAAAVLRAGGTDRAAVIEQLRKLELSTIIGPIKFDQDHVARTPLVGGQWVKGTKYPLELKVVFNDTAPNIPKDATFQPLA